MKRLRYIIYSLLIITLGSSCSLLDDMISYRMWPYKLNHAFGNTYNIIHPPYTLIVFIDAYEYMEKMYATAYQQMVSIAEENNNCFCMQAKIDGSSILQEIYLWTYFRNNDENFIRVCYIDYTGRMYSITQHYSGNYAWLNTWIDNSFDLVDKSFDGSLYPNVYDYISKDELDKISREEKDLFLNFMFLNKHELEILLPWPNTKGLYRRVSESEKQYIRDYKRYVEPFIKMKKVIATDETLQTVERK